jgi:predicted MarR family transcription regulator
LVGFCYLVAGFTNGQLVERVRALLHIPYTCRQATYDLRRLKRKGLIVRAPRSQRYHLTSLGRRVAVLFTKTYGRVLAPGLSAVDPHLSDELASRIPLATAWRRFERTLDDFIEAQLVAA